ncbi:MAG: thiamine-phosphate kinase [Terriglobia bacterium]
MRGEARLIERLRRRFAAGGGLRVGIGDDAAVFSGEGRRDWVVTADFLVENVHFLPQQPARAVGWKALARSLSDTAAMGARPRYALVSLALPARTPEAWVEEFYAGLGQLARRHGVRVAGGDLSAARQIVADVQMVGEVAKGEAVLRRGARPGHLLCVSGQLGLSRLGLACLRHRVASVRPLLKRAVRAHFFPQPRVRLGRFLAARGVSAMIDLSDGLSTDLAHLCKASRVGARLYAGKIPALKLPPAVARRFRTTALELALDGGEDYELLFALPKARARRLPKKLGGIPLTVVGEITRERRMVLVDSNGRERKLEARGWEHFPR